MFSFGIFASHTPFLIMAGLYLFYMLISFGMKVYQEPGDGIKDESKAIAYQEKEIIGDGESLIEIFPSDFQTDNAGQAVSHQQTHLWSNPTGNCLDWSYKQKCVLTFVDYYLFSRPPPILA